MSTEKKNCTMGMFRIGADRFKNQFGVMGKSLRNSRKKNRLFLFSSTCRESHSQEQKGSPANSAAEWLLPSSSHIPILKTQLPAGQEIPAHRNSGG